MGTRTDPLAGRSIGQSCSLRTDGAALRASVALWSFGFTLVAAMASLEGRGTLLLQIPLQGTFWLSAIALSIVLHAGWRRLLGSPLVVRWTLVGLACAAAGLAQTVLDLSTYAWLAKTWFADWRSWAVIDVPRFASVWILYTWTFGLNAALFWVLSANDEARRQARRAADAEAAVQAAQLALLRLQLNPHFLFNTLNAISGLVLERDVARADLMLTRLSDFLRASLDMEPTALTSLGGELDMLEAYLEIEAVRFDERLRVTYGCPDDLRSASVPGFILQPLVENAIKHAVAPALRPIRLDISARRAGEDLVLTVADDGDDRVDTTRGGGVGLRNIAARLATLYGPRGRLDVRRTHPGFRAEIRLPLEQAETGR
ncbi:MAG: histidine kinase [Phenylobacterium zucineum]|nr:MAG: histidine kinase [Phenylobacterium zucineum]